MKRYEAFMSVGKRYSQALRFHGNSIGFDIVHPCGPGFHAGTLLRECVKKSEGATSPDQIATQLNESLCLRHPGNARMFYGGVRIEDNCVDACTVGLFRVYMCKHREVFATRIHTREFDLKNVSNENAPLEDVGLAFVHRSIVTRSLGGEGSPPLDVYRWNAEVLDWIAVVSARWFENMPDEVSKRRVERFLDRGELPEDCEDDAILVVKACS